MIWLLFDALDDQLVSGGISLWDFYSLRTAFDLVDFIAGVNARSQNHRRAEFECFGLSHDLSATNLFVA
jgi:hypothetical protein